MRIFCPLLVLAGALFAQPAPQMEFFEKKIRPVLAEKCYGCHSAKLKTPMGGLRLDTRESLLKGGDSGAAIVPGDPAHSRLIAALSYQNELKMPPSGKLANEQLADFTAWVQMGAPDPRTGPPSAVGGNVEAKRYDFTLGRKFWAFQPVGHPAPPPASANPIDAFILAKLEAQGIKPAPSAGKRTLLRRVTYDLTGLPPTPEEMERFLADSSANAYEKVVDRLLASPHYGERWGRHWLDLVRYAETNGHEYDDDKLDPWRYRDYVIRAFNQDVPYDRLIREHIAGDLLPDPRLSADGSALESPVATAFYWFGEVLNSATDSEKSRSDEVDNQIDVMSKAFQGLTVACARCHDHKFDPIPTADYYALAGVMHSTDIREAVIDSPERMRLIQERTKQITSMMPDTRPRVTPSPFADWRISGAAFANAPERGIANSLGAGSDKFTGTLTSQKFRMPKLWVHVRIGGTKSDAKLKENGPLRFTLVADGYKGIHLASDGGDKPKWKSMRMTLAIGRMCYFEIVDRSGEGHIIVDKIVFSDSKEPPSEEAPEAEELPRPAGIENIEAKIPPSAFSMLASDWEAHNVRIHIRGNHKNLGEEAPRRYLQIVAGENQKPITSGSGRMEVANWIASPDNPLTARVMVNRIWQHHFGYGIVRTPDNFGKMGERPTHPELLDFLANEFVRGGWSIKAMHRMMLLSDTYRMSSRPDAAAAKLDPENKLLHHMPVRRLEAEAVRDTVLALSGRLDETMFGPSVPPYISSYQDGRGKPATGPLDGNGRRSVYIQVRRNFLTPMFLAFDYPLPISTIGTRGASTVPSQALIMMNNEFVTQQVAKWAAAVGTAESDADRKLTRMYEQAFSRPPEAKERGEIMEFLKDHSWPDLAHVLLNSPELLYIQ